MTDKEHTTSDGRGAQAASCGRNLVNEAEFDAALAGLLDEPRSKRPPTWREPLRRVVRRAVLADDSAFRSVRRAKRSDPPFVRQRLSEGAALHRFTEIGGRTQWEARCVADLVDMVATWMDEGSTAHPLPASWRDGARPASRRAAEAILRKLVRYDLSVLNERLRALSKLVEREAVRARWDEALFERTRIVGSAGREWALLTSLSEVRAAGERFGNCLSRRRGTERYAHDMLDGSCRIAVLRDANRRRNDQTPAPEHAIVQWDPTDRMLMEAYGRDGNDLAGKYREDVRQLMIHLRLCPTPYGLDAGLGLLRQTLPADPEPWMEGYAAGGAYRIWAWRNAALVEHGRSDPLYMTFRFGDGDRPREMGLSGPCTRMLMPDEDERAAAALTDAAVRAKRVPSVVGKLLGLAAAARISNVVGRGTR